MDLRDIRDYLYGLWIKHEMKKLHARGTKVIMVTGSYGKTSVKDLTYDLVRRKYRTVLTGRNYNTAVGITKTLRHEVMDNTEVLILEVGAYHVGEISRFAGWIKPDVGVITGIARQHLTRFGGWDQIKIAKTELARYIAKFGGVLVANGSDETVRELVTHASWYEGETREEINKAAAKDIARALGMSESEIKKSEKLFRAVPSRFEITTNRYGMRVIDDSYNSNEKSMQEAVKHLGKQKKYSRIIVTPGLLELGDESDKIHTELGRVIAENVDYAILVGDNDRTRSLHVAINGRVKVLKIDKTLEFVALVKGLKLKKEPLVLIENDIPEGL
ncbi:hypothetical protein KBD69_02810 [Candidatus Woesebacteria bacterium]|nr:hypothetical protein [Candidatus Woesebacteria bacterium]